MFKRNMNTYYFSNVIKRFCKIFIRNLFIRKFYQFISSHYLLSSLVFLPNSIRTHAFRYFLIQLNHKQKKDKLISLIKSKSIVKYFYPEIFPILTNEIWKSFDKNSIEKNIIPILSNKIEQSSELNDKQKFYNLLMIGAKSNLLNYSKEKKKFVRKPDFIIGGAQKAGTSWLKKALSNHPDVWMPPIELHYFSNNIREWSFDEYLGVFSNSEKKFVGEKSTTYIGVVEKIISKLPDAKIIFILRDPFERIVSHYFHVLRHGRLDNYNVTDFVRNNLYHCIDSGMYYENLNKYFNQIHIIFFEDIKKRPNLVIEQAARTIGLSPYNLEKMMPKRAINQGENKRKLNYKEYLRKNNLKEYLKKIYIDDIAQLEKLTGRNLSCWGEW